MPEATSNIEFPHKINKGPLTDGTVSEPHCALDGNARNLQSAADKLPALENGFHGR
jgi:hypothetical protein